jgi:hypothetical protein
MRPPHKTTKQEKNKHVFTKLAKIQSVLRSNQAPIFAVLLHALQNMGRKERLLAAASLAGGRKGAGT